MPAVVALRGLFAGAGSAMMSSSLVVDAVLELTRKPDPRDVRLLYLGELGTDVERYTHAAGDPECRPSVSSTGSARTHRHRLLRPREVPHEAVQDVPRTRRRRADA